MSKQFEDLIHGETNLLDFLDMAMPKEVEDLKDYVREYYRRDVLSRRVILSKIENYYYGKQVTI